MLAQSDILAAPILLEPSLGPDYLTYCGPLVDGIGTWVNLSGIFYRMHKS